MMINLSLPAGVVVPTEKDELFKKEISDKYKELKEAQSIANAIESELRRLRTQESIRKGLEAASIDTSDLISIIEDLLLTKSPVSKAFSRHEIKESKCKDWAKRTIKYSINKFELTQAINYLLDNINKKNVSLNLMRDYKILDIKSIANSGAYSAGLNKLKKQLNTTMRLKDKDDQLADKDKIISDKDIEIKKLHEDMLIDKREDWKLRAVELRKVGNTVADIARRLGKGRTSISNHLNSPEVKAELKASRAS